MSYRGVWGVKLGTNFASGVYNLSLSYVLAMESNMDGDVDINVDSAMHYNVDWPIRGSSKSTGYDW